MSAVRLLLGCLALPLFGAQATTPLIFEDKILPLLETRCAKCHSGSTAQARLDVRTRAALLKGGASGPAILLGAPDRSLLYQKVASGQMPPGGPRLSEPELQLIRNWIEQGAAAANLQASAPASGLSPADRAHWAFQPAKRPAVPAVKNASRVRNPIDAFVLKELEGKNLSFSPEADRLILLRRAYFDLIGLPPSPRDVDSFLNDNSPGAYERVIDKLLASPRYGERWARHWLDVAGYADSEGVLAADVIRTNAWRYRDYVIRAFNSDKPYDRFLTEQLAGDELVEYRNLGKITPQLVDTLAATGFLRTAVDATREDFLPEHFAEYQWRTLFDTQQIFASAVLGLTMQCARCHDHKYEPLTQRDYYRMEAFFMGGIRPDGPVLPSYKKLIFAAPADQQKAAEEHNAPLEAVVKAIKSLQTARQAQYRAKHPKGDNATEAELRKMFPEYAARAIELEKELREEEQQMISLPSIRAFYDLDASPAPTRILKRGDFLNPQDAVDPGVPVVLDDSQHPFCVPKPKPGATTTGRRRILAEWLTRPDHPLTARVMVNRIWAGHFGSGIVPSTDNFGKSGTPPSNQPLLDWLATEFVRQGWSMNVMHRLIMTSTVYRQSSRARAEALKIDPDNKLLWRMAPRRLEAEIIRDAMLQVADKLDLKMYGEPVETRTKPSGEVVPVDETCDGRRSIYQLVRRSQPQNLLNAFDAPVMEINCTRRVTSTSATQALAVMNSEFISAQAEHFAKRVLKQVPPAAASDANTVEYAFRLALARRPARLEMNKMLGFLKGQVDRYPGERQGERMLRAYADLCQALLTTNEFIYVD